MCFAANTETCQCLLVSDPVLIPLCPASPLPGQCFSSTLCGIITGGRRFSEGTSADREIQRTLMELLNQMDGFDALGQVKMIMATNRPDTLDPALLRPGRLDRKIGQCVCAMCILSLFFFAWHIRHEQSSVFLVSIFIYSV